jgi:hypothetical protein
MLTVYVNPIMFDILLLPAAHVAASMFACDYTLSYSWSTYALSDTVVLTSNNSSFALASMVGTARVDSSSVIVAPISVLLHSPSTECWTHAHWAGIIVAIIWLFAMVGTAVWLHSRHHGKSFSSSRGSEHQTTSRAEASPHDTDQSVNSCCRVALGVEVGNGDALGNRSVVGVLPSKQDADYGAEESVANPSLGVTMARALYPAMIPHFRMRYLQIKVLLAVTFPLLSLHAWARAWLLMLSSFYLLVLTVKEQPCVEGLMQSSASRVNHARAACFAAVVVLSMFLVTNEHAIETRRLDSFAEPVLPLTFAPFNVTLSGSSAWSSLALAFSPVFPRCAFNGCILPVVSAMFFLLLFE